MSEQANALTREEQEFAVEHCGLIDLHLKVNHLSSDQWWDVLVCSMASGLSGTEKAVLRLSTEGCSEREISKELGIPPKQVKEALAALRRRCTEEQIVEAV